MRIPTSQKCEIMSATVSAAQEKDRAGYNELVVHMPSYWHWEISGMGPSMKLHHVTNQTINITFSNDASPGYIWFK